MRGINASAICNLGPGVGAWQSGKKYEDTNQRIISMISQSEIDLEKKKWKNT